MGYILQNPARIIQNPAHNQFPSDVVERALGRQDGRCASCGAQLNRVKVWDSHHRKAVAEDGTQTLRNCVLFCRSGKMCHLKVGHGGDYKNHVHLSDDSLTYLYAGVR